MTFVFYMANNLVCIFSSNATDGGDCSKLLLTLMMKIVAISSFLSIMCLFYKNDFFMSKNIQETLKNLETLVDGMISRKIELSEDELDHLGRTWVKLNYYLYGNTFSPIRNSEN